MEDNFSDSNIDEAWENFCDEESLSSVNVFKEIKKNNSNNEQIKSIKDESIYKCSHLNISTKTKISYLNTPIDLINVFWKIPLIQYYEPKTGIIKKQMKFNSTTPEEVDTIINNKKKYNFVDDHIISQVHNNDGRNKYKDIRKISIGISRKDIVSYRCKKKSAFYNCFVVIMRLLYNNEYKEIHVKVFNTGKLEIPGIQDSIILNKVLDLLVDILKPIIKIDSVEPLRYLSEKSETVMINSNFSCGYLIDREKMFKLLKYTYKINSNFDSCSYPGIQCEFYYNTSIKEQSGIQPSTIKNNKHNTKLENNYIKVSFMIFRTGSVLIVGKCSEEILYEIYEFLCNIFQKEYNVIKGICIEPISTKYNEESDSIIKENLKCRKIRKKIIFVS